MLVLPVAECHINFVQVLIKSIPTFAGYIKHVWNWTNRDMKKLYIPSNESELVFIKSVLEADEVPFYVQNDNFGSLYSGAYMNYFNAKTIMVPEDYYEDAKEIIKSVVEDAEFPEFKDKQPPRVSDLFGYLISLLTLGLYSPGKNEVENTEKREDK